MRSFLGFGQKTYIGVPSAQAIKLGGIASQIVPLNFQWLAYGASTSVPNINVLVDLNGKVCSPLDQIRSIYIDNLGSDCPIYVYFPDSQTTIVAKPNSEGWYPAFTNARVFQVVGEGFLTGSIPQTLVVASNLYIPPSVNNEIDNAVTLYRASPLITRGNSIYNAGLGIPALGDQLFTSSLLDVTTVGATVPLWNTPYPSGFLYITNLAIYGIGISNGVANVGQLFIESTGVAGVLMFPDWFQKPDIPAGYSLEIARLTGLQTKLDATQTWRARITSNGDGGGIQIYSSFTQQP